MRSELCHTRSHPEEACCMAKARIFGGNFGSYTSAHWHDFCLGIFTSKEGISISLEQYNSPSYPHICMCVFKCYIKHTCVHVIYVYCHALNYIHLAVIWPNHTLSFHHSQDTDCSFVQCLRTAHYPPLNHLEVIWTRQELALSRQRLHFSYPFLLIFC